MGLIRNVLEAAAGAQETSALFLSLLSASSLLSTAGDVSVIICRADELQMLDYHHSIIDFKGHVSVSELITTESRHSNFYTVVGLKFAALTKIFMGALETRARGTL
ncbi:hypothetical protein CY35_14G099800 [Sphagnum magellanicum]|nr:hypothetical protein CY35_14G099800 [Sphagnum magellanicum]KAH9542130.1 hypothetical protein CY35_14G099800 [Sphagnum magellanicum]